MYYFIALAVGYVVAKFDLDKKLWDFVKGFFN